MKHELILTLERTARKSGGDRYSGSYKEEDVVIYLPQTISRINGTPLMKLVMTIEPATN